MGTRCLVVACYLLPVTCSLLLVAPYRIQQSHSGLNSQRLDDSARSDEPSLYASLPSGAEQISSGRNPIDETCTWLCWSAADEAGNQANSQTASQPPTQRNLKCMHTKHWLLLKHSRQASPGCIDDSSIGRFGSNFIRW